MEIVILILLVLGLLGFGASKAPSSKSSSPPKSSGGWYIHYWYNGDGSVSGFVDRDTYIGKAPSGDHERIEGPFSTETDARRRLRAMNG